MASLTELYKIATLLCPVFTSLFAFLILFLDIRSSKSKPLRISYYLLAYFLMVSFSWISAILYFYTPKVFIYVNWLSMLVFILTQVFYYGFIFEVTRKSKVEFFSRWHFLIPVLLSGFLLVLSLITPVDDQLNTILSNENYKGGSRLFYELTYSKMFFRLIFSLVYTVMGFYRLSGFHKFIRNFSSNEEKGSLRWVYVLLFFSTFLIIVPLLVMLIGRDKILTSFLSIFPIGLLLFQYVYICLHVIKKDHFIVELTNEEVMVEHSTVLISQKDPIECLNENPIINGNNNEYVDEAVAEVQDTASYLKKNALSRELFDNFMKNEKPYLNPDLKITDLVDIFCVNRTYISNFVNSEYGINFSCYINSYRLMEYQNLKKMPENAALSKQELIELSGFNSYRSFQRIDKGPRYILV